MKSLTQHRRLFTKIKWLALSAGLLSAVVTVSMMFVTPLTQAQSQAPVGYSLKVLHNFTGPDGETPLSYATRDAVGNLYGTTEVGGAAKVGAVFEVDVKGKETVLHSFSGSDGAYPAGPLLQDASGNLYGTTFFGGNLSACNGLGCGEVFKIDTNGTFTVLYAFTNTNGDGILAGPGLVQDATGNLYGTTQNGGTGVCTWSYWGTCGTVFKIDPTGKETVLYSFRGANGDGAEPFTTLVVDSAGYIYGATQFGGDYSGVCAKKKRHGCGTVWKLDPINGKETVLHLFAGSGGDGSDPNPGGYLDADGNFYGTAPHGGNLKSCPSSSSIFPGCGIVFRIDTSGTYTVLHKFSGPDGRYPGGPLIQDERGNFYGTTDGGGTYGPGTVFKMSTSDNKHFRVSTLFSFSADNSEPKNPLGSVVRDANGSLYGLSYDGGGWGAGAVFKLTPK